MRTRVLAIALAAVLALVGVVAILAYVRQANERAVAGLKAETVLVAASQIPAGTSLDQAWSEHLLRSEDVPVSSLANAGTPVSSAIGKDGQMVVDSTIAEGLILFKDMLAPAGTAATGSSGGFAVPPKKSAISVDICVPEDVASYITPGASVAVFDILVPDTAASTTTPSCASDHPVLGRDQITNTTAIGTVCVLPTVEVLAVGQNPGNQSGSASGAASAVQPAASASSSTDIVVTFAVDQEQAEQLMVLQQYGIPYLVLLGSQFSMNAGLAAPQL